MERVFLRIGSAETDDQLESCLDRFLPPVLLKLNSSEEAVRKKVKLRNKGIQFEDRKSSFAHGIE